ncbi:MAG TPA: N-methyl-D-aspartate receptor NMDAR2C subunit [Armatimonadota bacterium]|jgi:predicted metal-dependent HD superfamily phosphohydrolase
MASAEPAHELCNIAHWIRLCRHAGAVARIDDSYRAVIARYDEPPRAYHNLGHVAHCLAEFDLLVEDAECAAAVAFAIWFHDAVYDTHRADNEQQSADFALQTLNAMRVPATITERVPDLILLTRHVDTPVTRDGQLIVDVDLAILAAPPAVFDDYEARIRQEYAWVDEALFWRKRREFLVTLLQRPAIFHTPHFHTRYEERARQNLRRAIAHAETLLGTPIS